MALQGHSNDTNIIYTGYVHTRYASSGFLYCSYLGSVELDHGSSIIPPHSLIYMNVLLCTFHYTTAHIIGTFFLLRWPKLFQRFQIDFIIFVIVSFAPPYSDYYSSNLVSF